MSDTMTTVDPIILEYGAVLDKWRAVHPDARTDIYRQNSAAVRIRIVDPSFAGMTRGERSRLVRRTFGELSEDAKAELTFLLLVTPNELPDSLANVEFENPEPSDL